MTMSALSLSLDMACTNEHIWAELAHLKIKQVMNLTELKMIMAERKKPLQKEMDIKNKVELEKRKKALANLENVKKQFVETKKAKKILAAAREQRNLTSSEPRERDRSERDPPTSS